MQPQGFLKADGVSLEYRWIEAARPHLPTLVFLHEGLGCVEMWKDFPDQVAQTTGCGAFIYSRAGYGRSGAALLPRPVRYMHHEGLVVLPQVMEQIPGQKHILVGHSDGGSIALIYAGSGKAQGLCGLVLLAPHVFNESLCVEAIGKAGEAFKTTPLSEKLARYHGEQTEAAFWGWHDVWLHPDFWHWNLEEYLPAITAPLLVIQSEEDPYGTLRQVETIQQQTLVPARELVLPNCGHAPHVDQRHAVLRAMGDFIQQQVFG